MIPHPHVWRILMTPATTGRRLLAEGSIVEVELAAFTHGRHMDERRAAASSPKCERASGGSSACRCASRASASTPAQVLPPPRHPLQLGEAVAAGRRLEL
uniref:Uncharacterized protein n=1 Tax=Setaria viridis TaxID=4556 RepID=A0A4V6D4G4_SETVI|nr:hypothetical protein SEVIR_7G240100v2 [Setaria viridis]